MNSAGHICIQCTYRDAQYYLDCFCCFCSQCYTGILKDKISTMMAKKKDNPTNTVQCVFCKQYINMNVVDGCSEKYKSNLAQLNANPSTMLKSTVRNLDFKEKQMMAKNKFLTNKSRFMETLLREIVKSNSNLDLRNLPKELIEQDKFNLIESLKRSLIERKRPVDKNNGCKQREEGLKSKSENQLLQEHTAALSRMTINNQTNVTNYKTGGMVKSKSLNDTAHPTPASGNYYGFEFRNIKKQTGTGGDKNSAKVLEEKLSNFGQNRILHARQR